MKRTNLVLDEKLLEEFVRRIRARQILTLTGSGAWEGDLATMREYRYAVGDKSSRSCGSTRR